jgi:hypothetical protein
MVDTVEIKVDEQDIQSALALLKDYPRRINSVLNNAINRTTTSARTASVKKIAKDTKLKQGDLYKKGDIRRPIIQTKSTTKTLRATIESSGRRIPLIVFKAKQAFKRRTKKQKAAGAKQKGKGVSYNLGKGRAIVPDGFITEVFGKPGRLTAIITGRAGHRGVFTRGGKSRLPIYEKFGPSIHRVYSGTSGILTQAVEIANKRLPKEINGQVNVILERRRAKLLKEAG